MLSQERLKELFFYDKVTGVFTNKITRNSKAIKGDVAGHKTFGGAVRLGIDYDWHFAQNLVWLYVYGKFPENKLDFINGTKSDFRLNNLRESIRHEKLSQKELKRQVNYNKKTGEMTRRVVCSTSLKVGDKVGWDANGYTRAMINGKTYGVHNLTYLYVNGTLPKEGAVDHIDRNGLNNKWDNLRLVDNTCQMRNQGVQKNNKSGVNGVCWCGRRDRWVALIGSNGKQKQIGYFRNLTDAVFARYASEQSLNWRECDINTSARKYLVVHGLLNKDK